MFCYSEYIRKYKRERAPERERTCSTKNRIRKNICRALAWQHGDKDAAEALLKQYQPLIRSIRLSFCQGLSYEDLEQELILHFLEQTACYDPKKNPSFAGYITPRLRWQRMNRIRKEMTREDHEELTLEDQAEGTSLDDYGEAKATLEEVARLARLTKKQKPVFFLWMQGLTPMEISTRTGDSLPSITRKKQRIQRQLSKYAKEIRGLVVGD